MSIASSSVARATFRAIDNYVWLVAAIMDNAATEHFPRHRSYFYGAVLV